jgi:hypothetical protein
MPEFNKNVDVDVDVDVDDFLKACTESEKEEAILWLAADGSLDKHLDEAIEERNLNEGIIPDDRIKNDDFSSRVESLKGAYYQMSEEDIETIEKLAKKYG